jgi:hypothetical protein
MHALLHCLFFLVFAVCSDIVCWPALVVLCRPLLGSLFLVGFISVIASGCANPEAQQPLIYFCKAVPPTSSSSAPRVLQFNSLVRSIKPACCPLESAGGSHMRL